MNRELLLLRHAEASWPVDTEDFFRPLNEAGRQAALQVGQWLWEQQLIPDAVLCSPATRALTTAQLVCQQIAISDSFINYDRQIYEANSFKLQHILKTSDCVQRLLLIGHNPGMENLLQQLVPEPIPLTDHGHYFPTAALAQIIIHNDWHQIAPGCGTLKALIRTNC